MKISLFLFSVNTSVVLNLHWSLGPTYHNNRKGGEAKGEERRGEEKCNLILFHLFLLGMINDENALEQAAKEVMESTSLKVFKNRHDTEGYGLMNMVVME